jgi:hypothetical protein
MSIDHRTRLYRDFHPISRDEIFDSLLPDAVERNGELAGRGLRYKQLPSLALEVDGRAVTLAERDGKMMLDAGHASAGARAALTEDALSELLQDKRTTMGLAMNSMVKMETGRLDAFVGWEPVFRALVDGRPVYEAGDVVPRAKDGGVLDLDRSFTLDDDRDDISHFLHEAGFLHIEGVFSEEEMAAVSADLDVALERARRDDGASWWAGDSQGVEQPVRILWFHERSNTLRDLLYDDRLQWLADLPGDGHDGSKMGAEGLVKPLDIRTGLSDLPWHKDCGQGGHSYMCSGMTVGISVTGADRRSGALGVVPGSHRANCQTAGIDPSLDLEPIKLETHTGDITMHCSDTLHMSHHPIDRPRKVVYTGFRLPPRSGDVVPSVSKEAERAARARLTDVRDRIDASDSSEAKSG